MISRRTVVVLLVAPPSREAARALGIVYERVTQAALIPVAYTHGTEFAPAKREPLERVLHWDQW